MHTVINPTTTLPVWMRPGTVCLVRNFNHIAMLFMRRPIKKNLCLFQQSVEIEMIVWNTGATIHSCVQRKTWGKQKPAGVLDAELFVQTKTPSKGDNSVTTTVNDWNFVFYLKEFWSMKGAQKDSLAFLFDVYQYHNEMCRCVQLNSILRKFKGIV